MQMQMTSQTVGVLANANELVRLVTLGLVGGELSAAIQGSAVTRDMLYTLTQAKIQSRYATILEK